MAALQAPTLKDETNTLTTPVSLLERPPGLPPEFPSYTAYVAAICTPSKLESRIFTVFKRGSRSAVTLFKAVEPVSKDVANAFPPFGLAVVGVLAIIKRAIEVGDLKEEVLDCAQNVAKFLDTVYNYLNKSPSEPDVSSTIRKFTEILERDVLTPIRSALQDIVDIPNQRSRKIFLRMTPYREKLKACQERLPGLIDVFLTLCQLEIGQGIDTIGRQLDKVMDRDQTIDQVIGVMKSDLEVVAASLNNLESHLHAQDRAQERDHGEIITHLNHIQQNFKPAPSQQVRKYEPLPVTPLPPDLCGRIDEQIQLVNILLHPGNNHTLIYGIGGMGKSSLALAILAKEEIKARFPDRFFVRLDKVTGSEALVEVLHRICPFHASDEEHARTTLLNYFRSAPKTLIVLDNFETPFDQEPAECEDLLRELSSIPTVTLILTTRNPNVYLNGERKLEPLQLEGLPLPEAIDLFLQTAQKPSLSREDPIFLELMRNLDGHSLSIILIARRSVRDDIHNVWKRWNIEKTALAAARPYGPQNALTNLDVCIKLSINSPIMDDAARQLLSVLAIFPDGLLPDQIARALPNMPATHDRLFDTSLASRSSGDPVRARIRLLVPIREHVNRYRRLPDDDVDRLMDALINAGSDPHRKASPVISPLLRYAAGPQPSTIRIHRITEVALCHISAGPRVRPRSALPRVITDTLFDLWVRLAHLSSDNEDPMSLQNKARCLLLSTIESRGYAGDFGDPESLFARIDDKEGEGLCLMYGALARSTNFGRVGMISDYRASLKCFLSSPCPSVIALRSIAWCLEELVVFCPVERDFAPIGSYHEAAMRCIAILRELNDKPNLTRALNRLSWIHAQDNATLDLAKLEYEILLQVYRDDALPAMVLDTTVNLSHISLRSDDPVHWACFARLAGEAFDMSLKLRSSRKPGKWAAELPYIPHHKRPIIINHSVPVFDLLLSSWRQKNDRLAEAECLAALSVFNSWSNLQADADLSGQQARECIAILVDFGHRYLPFTLNYLARIHARNPNTVSLALEEYQRLSNMQASLAPESSRQCGLLHATYPDHPDTSDALAIRHFEEALVAHIDHEPPEDETDEDDEDDQQDNPLSIYIRGKRNARALLPNDVRDSVRYSMGCVYIRMQELTKARDTLIPYTRARFCPFACHFRLAQISRLFGEFTHAKTQLRTLVDTYWGGHHKNQHIGRNGDRWCLRWEAEGLYELGLVHEALGEFDEAEKVMECVRKIHERVGSRVDENLDEAVESEVLAPLSADTVVQGLERVRGKIGTTD